eukprot:bmy_12632T0
MTVFLEDEELSGLCQLDDSCETSKSVQEMGESIQGEKESGKEEDTATNKTEESPGMSAGLLAPSGETGFRAEAVRALEGGLRPPSLEN